MKRDSQALSQRECSARTKWHRNREASAQGKVSADRIGPGSDSSPLVNKLLCSRIAGFESAGKRKLSTRHVYQLRITRALPEKESPLTQSKTIAQFDSDHELVKRAQRGDSEAFASLFQLHKGRVHSVCLRMTNNIAEAEDLTQDTFLQAFRKLNTFRCDSAIATWIYRIAVNIVLMQFRKKMPRYTMLDDPESPSPKGICDAVRDDRLERSVDRIALTRAITDLPDGYRNIYLLHEVQGYNHREIAHLLECSVGNSKSQLHKAKIRIRLLLQQPRAEQATSSVRAPRLGARRSTRWEPEQISSELAPRPLMFPGTTQFRTAAV
jgi:RNA polymerase sigma-70 factor (ECF subfamily)